jgi:hypothetical protein
MEYDPKVHEFRAYCNHRMYNKDPATKYTITYIKTHEFMFYQAMRPRRKRGGKREQDKLPTFDCKESDHILSEYHYCGCTQEDLAEPEKPLGYAQLNTYKAAVHSFHDEQVADNINNIPWEMVWNADLKLLMQMV